MQSMFSTDGLQKSTFLLYINRRVSTSHRGDESICVRKKKEMHIAYVKELCSPAQEPQSSNVGDESLNDCHKTSCFTNFK